MNEHVVALIRILIPCLQQIVALLQQLVDGQPPEPTRHFEVPDDTTEAESVSIVQETPLSTPTTSRAVTPTQTLRQETPRRRSPRLASASPSSPTSPSAWRGQGNLTLLDIRRHFYRTGVCQHYIHETARPRLDKCPACVFSPDRQVFKGTHADVERILDGRKHEREFRTVDESEQVNALFEDLALNAATAPDEQQA